MAQGRKPGPGWGIIGAGEVAHRFAFDLTKVSGARLIAVSSRSAERGAAAAAAMGAGAACVGRDSLLARPDIDVVYIATPIEHHHADCLAAIAAGKAVLCEKPLAASRSQAEAIARSAQAAGVFCMEGLWTHFLPAVHEAVSRVQAGRIGHAAQLTATFGVPGGPTADGVLLDRGCYLISLALRFLGSAVSAVAGPQAGPGEASAALGFADGGAAMLSCSASSWLDNRLFLGGDAGWLSLEGLVCPTALRMGGPGRPSHKALDPSSLRERARRMARSLGPLVRIRRALNDRTEIIACRGYGFSHEIEEVHACLAAGHLQSAVHPLSRSIETLGIIDHLRHAQRVGEGAIAGE